MNIFFLSWNPKTCAQWHCDQHCVKMILEYTQILSTVHRYLDGSMCIEKTKKNRKVKRYTLPDIRENVLYKATHINHPSVQWATKSSDNYKWLYLLVQNLCLEYTRRYNRIHKSESLLWILHKYPKNIERNKLTLPPLAMPDEYKCNNVILSYRIFYITSKSRFSTWKYSQQPWWSLI